MDQYLSIFGTSASSSSSAQSPLMNEQNRQEARTPTSSSFTDWHKHPSRAPSSAGVTPLSPPLSSASTTTSDPNLDTWFAIAGVPTSATPPSSAGSQQPSYQPFFSQQQFAATSNGQYGAVPYSSASWSQVPQVHLSSYSSLNGATTSGQSNSSTPQPPSQQRPQHSPPPHRPPSIPMIDPALTMNGSTSSNGIHYSSTPSTPAYTQSQHQPSQQPVNPYMSLTGSYLYQQHPYSQLASASLQQQQQQASQSRGTLSPQALHSPSPPNLGIAPHQFYGKPGQPSSITPTPQPATSTPPQTASPSLQERKTQFLASIRPLISKGSVTGGGAVKLLVNKIDDYGSQDVDAETRKEILTHIRDNAGNAYFRSWSENPTAMDITREWLKAPITTDDDELVDTLMPLLHILDRLPISLENLKASKLGKLIVRLSKNPPSPAIKDMAQNIERKWRMLLDGTNGKDEEGPRAKKQKLDPAPPAKPSSIGKKPAASTSSKPTTIKKVAPPPPTKDAKSDSSFFSTRVVPKKPLPKFSKAPVVKKEETNIALPSAANPFQEILKSMGKNIRTEQSTTPPIASGSGSEFKVLNHGSKKRKTVSWAPDGDLEKVRFIEKAIYDDDPLDGTHSAHSLRELERGEGAALHTVMFEETVDWFDPPCIDIPEELAIGLKDRGADSTEKATQERREESALSAVYMSQSTIPSSPAETASVIPDAEVDAKVIPMLVGDENQAFFWNTDVNPGPPTPMEGMMMQQQQQQQQQQRTELTPVDLQAVQSIVSQYNSVGGPANAAATTSVASSLSSYLAPDKVQYLLSQLGAPPPSAGVPPPTPNAFGADDQQWTNGGPNYNAEAGFRDDGCDRWDGGVSGRGRGGGGRGRGRGGGFDAGNGNGNGNGGFRHNKRKPCHFFQGGRCKYGDQCDFVHEYVS